jgi:lysophospholipid acyltransferase (LPLAT)-like uncharacterized protein
MAGVTAATTRVVVPQALKWHGKLAAWLIYALIRVLSATIRYEWKNPTRLATSEEVKQLIFCIWHNRLSLCALIYKNYMQQEDASRRMAAMVSASRDGGLLARILELFRVQPVRGSTSRRGPQALRELTTWAEQGYDLAITPDGPRGPCYAVQDGVISLAALTGLAIVPVSYRLHWKVRLKSWDRFQVPLPFTKCDIQVGPLVYVPREATEEQRETLRLTLERHMRDITSDE